MKGASWCLRRYGDGLCTQATALCSAEVLTAVFPTRVPLCSRCGPSLWQCNDMARIEDYAVVGDLHTGALISTAGSIDWLCLPRFDSPACFSALVDTPDAGRWLLAPESGGTCTRRSYVDGTLVLETEWETPDGTVKVIDFMPPRDEVADIVRIVEGVTGSVRMHSELAMRFDYGHIVPWVRKDKHGLHAIAGPDAAYFVTTAPVHGENMQRLHCPGGGARALRPDLGAQPRTAAAHR